MTSAWAFRLLMKAAPSKDRCGAPGCRRRFATRFDEVDHEHRKHKGPEPGVVAAMMERASIDQAHGGKLPEPVRREDGRAPNPNLREPHRSGDAPSRPKTVPGRVLKHTDVDPERWT